MSEAMAQMRLLWHGSLRRPRWRRLLCLLTASHDWRQQPDHTFACHDCEATQEFMPWH
jgi:hypothetical protein